MARSRFRHAALFAALALLIPSRLRTQAPSLEAGVLVRVGTADPGGRTHRRIGSLVAIGDSVVLSPRDSWKRTSRLAIARSSVTSLEVGRPAKGHRLRYAVIGAIGGAVIGYNIADKKRTYSCGQCDGAAQLYQATDAAVGAAIGLVGGALIGVAVGQPRTRWTPVTLPGGTFKASGSLNRVEEPDPMQSKLFKPWRKESPRSPDSPRSPWLL